MAVLRSPFIAHVWLERNLVGYLFLWISKRKFIIVVLVTFFFIKRSVYNLDIRSFNPRVLWGQVMTSRASLQCGELQENPFLGDSPDDVTSSLLHIAFPLKLNYTEADGYGQSC